MLLNCVFLPLEFLISELLTTEFLKVQSSKYPFTILTSVEAVIDSNLFSTSEYNVEYIPNFEFNIVAFDKVVLSISESTIKL